MADKQNIKLNNLFFFGVSFVNYDTTDVTCDIITNIRRRFLISKKPASNKLYRSANGESFVYSYNFSLQHPLQWRVLKNKRVVEEIEHLLSNKYCINRYDDQGKDLKKTFFDSKHRWFKTNYYSSVSTTDIVCSLVPKEFDEGTSLLKYMTGEIYPERLYPCSVPSCEEVRNRVLSKIPTPLVSALTNQGVIYFMSDVDKDNYEHVLAEEEAAFKAENAPEVFVTEEDLATGFNLSAKDFDMSKNLNRTFDISLAADFDSSDAPILKSSEKVAEISVDEPLVPAAVDDGSVDAAITGVVEQINALTSLDINADEILGFNLDALDDTEDKNVDFIENGDFITFSDSDRGLDEQLKHIDSVLDGSSLLTSDRRLVIGENVVDDDYISSIIDGIISSAFSTDDADGPELDSEQEVTEVLDEVAEEISTVEPDVEIIEEINADSLPATDAETDIAESRDNADDGEEPSAEEVDALVEEILSKLSSADEYIKENPADAYIESRGEVYSYYGEVDSNGKRSGRGRTLTSDGNIAYEGEYKDDKRTGKGSFYFKDGSLCYWGNWDNNVRSGFGVGVSSDDRAVHAGNWHENKPSGTGVRFDNEGNLMFISSNCSDKKKGFTISDFSDSSFTIRVWSEKDDAFIQREISINDIIK